ncbi:unnamed protein product [Mytilus coruscus]|uniref:HSPA12B n=1 Tax=Mytilus coruscus TaxID=42192 RepID=A0A6J8F018_MYTCO|nr:unnamed protein product [Mytilus coruscus]
MNLVCPLKAASIPIGDCFFVLKGSDKKTPPKRQPKHHRMIRKQQQPLDNAVKRQKRLTKQRLLMLRKSLPKKTESPPSRSRSADLSKRNRTSASSEAKHDGANIVKDIENKKKHKLLVAAIDFGTTYSGYAFLTKDDFETFKADNSMINCPTWNRKGGLRGTTDITVHEVTGPNTLNEIHQACGGHYGGNTVNAEFFKFLTTLLSGPVIREIRGAVLYGFVTHAITERVSQYTYGVAMQKPYDPDVYDASKIANVRGRGGKRMVDDVFDKHIEIGKVCKIGEFEEEHD